MTQPNHAPSRVAAIDLRERAREIVSEHGFVSEFAPDVRAEVARIGELHEGDRVSATHDDIHDLRSLPWTSIDNRETRDLDQVEVCEPLDAGVTRLRLGVADVDHLVPKDSAIDRRAAANTTSLYTGVETFSMLPEELSTDLTSLVEGAERLVVVVDLVVDGAGEVTDVSVYRARIVNRAKLAYDSVGMWLAGAASIPEAFAALPGLEAQIRLQDDVARRLRLRRHERGALDLETIEARPVTSDGDVVDLEVTRKSRARELIEDFMIAANAATAQYLEMRRVPSIRRVVRAPRRWPRIVELAKRNGHTLPDEPSSAALADFLRRRRTANPDAFADLSLSVVKLLGSGEYVVERPWEPDGDEGHFGLALDDYSHTTAPNRRYADLVMQRLVKASVAGAPAPYTATELDAIAERCTVMEDAAGRVEREMRKVVAATLMAHRVGETFDAIVTGVNRGGTFARLIHPPVEGRVMRGEDGMDVGDRVRLELVEVDVAKAYIDFARAEG
jgi:VacB/RNase II family 3'-5' exoribonuclease